MRKAELKRKTKETDISLKINLDGKGKSSISTKIGFFDHMLESFSRHSLMALDLKVDGDLHVDSHHTIEDTGIVLGQAMKEALGDKKGIKRFGFASIPMDEALTEVSVDLGGRAYAVYNCHIDYGMLGQMAFEDIEEFVFALANGLGANIHINVRYGSNRHHVAESIFKALARSLREAVSIDQKEEGIPSTKGII
ncbi:MAG: imidazoleglycerol-phosphate dehydratase HisB [Tissierellales bacterium]